MFKWLQNISVFKSAYDVEAEGAVPEVLQKVPATVDAAERGSFVVEANSVNAEKAVAAYCFNPDVYAVVNLKAQMLSSLDFKIFAERRGTGLRTELRDGPLFDLIENPNPHATRSQLILQFCSWHYLTGSAYIVSEEIHGERYLICLNSKWVYPVVVAELGISGIVYKRGTKAFYYSDDQILRWVNFSPNDDFYGMSPVQPLADDVQARKSAMRHTKNHYKRGGISGGVLTTDSGLEEGELRKLRKDWENRKEDSSRLIILPDGWGFQEIKGSESGTSPEDVISFTQSAVYNAFGVPVSLGSPDKNTHPTESEIFLWTSQLFPDANVIGQLFTAKFGVKNNRQRIVFEFDKKKVPVLRKYELESTRIRTADISTGYRTVNDFLEEEDLPTLTGENEEFGNTPRPLWIQQNSERMAEQAAQAQASATAGTKPTMTLPNDPAGRDQSTEGEKPIGVDASGKK